MKSSRFCLYAEFASTADSHALPKPNVVTDFTAFPIEAFFVILCNTGLNISLMAEEAAFVALATSEAEAAPLANADLAAAASSSKDPALAIFPESPEAARAAPPRTKEDVRPPRPSPPVRYAVRNAPVVNERPLPITSLAQKLAVPIF